MGKRISELTAISGGTFATTDLFEISVDAGSGTFVSRKITGQEMIDSIGGDTNIGNSNLTIDVSGTRKLILGGALSTDTFSIRNSADTKTFFEIRGNGSILPNGFAGSTTTVSLGGNVLDAVTSGYQNTGVGANALTNLSSGYMTTAIGYQSLQANTTGFQNTAIGYQSGINTTTGKRNTFLGWQSGLGITTGSDNTIVGKATGLSSSLSNHVIINDGQQNKSLYMDNNENITLGNHSALATTATNGFNYVRGGAGTPTGTPATSYTGHVPMYVDTTNNKMYIYSGGSWVALN